MWQHFCTGAYSNNFKCMYTSAPGYIVENSEFICMYAYSAQIFMKVCLCMHIFTCICTCILPCMSGCTHVFTDSYIHMLTYIHTQACLSVYIQSYIHIYIHINIHVCFSTYIQTYLYGKMHAYTCVCLAIHIDLYTDIYVCLPT